MVQAQGIIADILGKIDYCELCEAPAVTVDALDIYTIGTYDPDGSSSMADSIVVLCPDCKKKHDSGIVSRKHLKACVILRAPDTVEWLKDLFNRYGLGSKQSDVKKRPVNRTFFKLVNDQAYLNNLVFISSILLIVIGILLFSVGYHGSGSIDVVSAGAVDGPGLPGQGLFSQFLEMAGVTLALMGLFFQLGLAKRPSSPSK